MNKFSKYLWWQKNAFKKERNKKGYLSPDVPPHLQLSGIQGYFLDWDSAEATNIQDIGQRVPLRLETGCNIWLFDVKGLALSHITEI